MAERRMFAKSIVLSDAFLDMPATARCLYFTLGMFADDDGFVGSPKGIMRQCGASQDDMQILLAKRFLLSFESGVIVIKHWRINNYLQSDRHKDTTYLEELDTLKIDEKGAYTEKDGMYTLSEPIEKEKKELTEAQKKRLEAKKESDLPSTFEQQIRNAFVGRKCPICGQLMSYSNNIVKPTIQHNKPISLGGKHEIENISVICASCNTSIQNRTETPPYNTEEVKAVWECIGNVYTGKDSIVKDSIDNINYCQKAQEIVDLYHECCPSLPKVMTISPKRISLVKARLKDYKTEQIKEIFIKAESSEFLRNGSGTWKGANFDWILNPNNFIKIMEGNYDNNKNAVKKTGYDLYRETKSSNYDFEALEREINHK